MFDLTTIVANNRKLVAEAKAKAVRREWAGVILSGVVFGLIVLGVLVTAGVIVK